MYLLIDNYDSFTYNLADLLTRLGKKVSIFFNDQLSIEAIEKEDYEAIIISPGPSRPENAGNIIEVIKHFHQKLPILGICLGHQAIGAAMDLSVVKCPVIMHGKLDQINCISDPLFIGINKAFNAVRYHSLVIENTAKMGVLKTIAFSESDHEIMAVKHEQYPVYGLQFHPESYETKIGEKLMTNFFDIVDKFHEEMPDVEAVEAAYQTADHILNMNVTKEVASNHLLAMQKRGENISEISGFAKAMKENALKLSGHYTKLADTCGTGGDGLHTYNISTCSAFVLAAAGVHIAKHGNRSVSSLCGSADVLEALGAHITLTPNQANAVLSDAGIVFLFAQAFHPKMKNVMPIRRSIDGPTVFNIIGPLSNPAPLTHQIIGVYHPRLMLPMLTSMASLGVKSAAVVHGFGGMDELSLEGENNVIFYKAGKMSYLSFDPINYGFPRISNASLRGGDAAVNAKAMRNALQGQCRAFEEAVILNAGLSLYVFEETETLEEGFEKARTLVKSGAALEALNRFIIATQVVQHEYS